MKNFDMEQCLRILHSWWDTKLVPAWRWNLWTPHALKQQAGFTNVIFQYIHQTQSSLTYQMPTLFSKEHVISWSHPYNLVCRWDPLDPLKKWPKWPRLSGSSYPLSTLIHKTTDYTTQIYKICIALYSLFDSYFMSLQSS